MTDAARPAMPLSTRIKDKRRSKGCPFPFDLV